MSLKQSRWYAVLAFVLIVLYAFCSGEAVSPVYSGSPQPQPSATPALPAFTLHEMSESKPVIQEMGRMGARLETPAADLIGPDPFGYTVTDSDESHGPDFDWQDIASTGVDLNLSDDSYVYPLQLPFVFDFYGQGYDAVAVGSNGVLYFQDAYLGLENTSLPDTNVYGVPALVAVYWDDLDPGAGGAVFYEIQGTAPDRRLVVQWQDVPLYGQADETITAQAVLFEATANILVQYASVPSQAGAGATEGIQGDESTGLLYGFDQALLSAELALCYAYPGNATDCSGAGVVLAKTVGLDPGSCSDRDLIVVTPGTEVAYCYRAENISGIPFTRHDLQDSQLGTLVSSLPLTLNPGEYTQEIRTGMLFSSTTNTGTWTAYNPGPTDETAGTDTATVLVPEAEPLTCAGDPVGFENGIPSDWLVVDDQGTGVVWTLSGSAGYPYQCGEENYTEAGGFAACVSSEAFVEELFDTSLVSPVFGLVDVTEVALTYQANYQNFAGLDNLDLEISEDGGSTWTALLSWNEDHGGNHTPPGEAVSVDLSSYIGQSNLRLRWRYHISEDYAWYAQIDRVSLDCSAPSLRVDPDSVEAVLFPEETAMDSLILENQGGLPLGWTVAEQHAGATPCTPADVAWLALNPAGGNIPSQGSDTVDVQLDAAGLNAGTYEAEICLSSDDPLQPYVVIPVTLTVDPMADLSISKDDDRDPAFVFTTMEYTLTVSNLGPSNATGLSLEDQLPAESVFLGTQPGPWTCTQDTGVLSCSLAALASGDQAILEYSIQLPGKDGTVSNQVTVTAAEFDPNPADNTISEETLLLLRKIYLPFTAR